MKLLTFALFIGIQCHVASSQSAPPPPPPPLIYAAPDALDIKQFVDSENKFKVSFPGVPQKSVTSGKEPTELAYKVYRKGSNSSITVLVFPINIELRAKEFYDSYKQELPNLTSQAPSGFPSKASEIVFDREVKIGEITAREFGYRSDYHFTQVAIFIQGNRFFEIKSDITNWHILTQHYPEIVKAFMSEADRFRNSFSILK